jgi:hypothetical protein
MLPPHTGRASPALGTLGARRRFRFHRRHGGGSRGAELRWVAKQLPVQRHPSGGLEGCRTLRSAAPTREVAVLAQPRGLGWCRAPHRLAKPGGPTPCVERWTHPVCRELFPRAIGHRPRLLTDGLRRRPAPGGGMPRVVHRTGKRWTPGPRRPDSRDVLTDGARRAGSSGVPPPGALVRTETRCSRDLESSSGSARSAVSSCFASRCGHRALDELEVSRNNTAAVRPWYPCRVAHSDGAPGTR